MTQTNATEAPSIADQIAAVARSQGGTSGPEFTALLAQVAGESAFQTQAVNKSTGAAGPFQFVKNTWLSLVHDYGKSLGINPDLVGKIALDHHGHPHIDDPAALQTVLDLRHDVGVSAKVAGKLYDVNRRFLQHSLKRAPTDPEIHLAFLLGGTGATHLIKAAEQTPDKPADQVVGAAARANRGLFQDRSGKMRGALDAVAFISAKYAADKARVAAYLKTTPATPKAQVTA